MNKGDIVWSCQVDGIDREPYLMKVIIEQELPLSVILGKIYRCTPFGGGTPRTISQDRLGTYGAMVEKYKSFCDYRIDHWHKLKNNVIII